MTPISLIPFKLGMKRGGEFGGEQKLMSRLVEVEGGKRRRVGNEEDVGAQVDPEMEWGKGPKVGIKVGGVSWLVGVEGVVEELGRLCHKP